MVTFCCYVSRYASQWGGWEEEGGAACNNLCLHCIPVQTHRWRAFFLPPPYKVTDTHFAAVFEISTRWPRGQLDPKSTFIERRPPHPPAVVTFFRSCCHIRMLTLCLKASRDLLGCKKKATWLMTRSVISTGKSCTDPGFTSPADVMFSRCVPVDCLPSELAQSPLLPRRQEDGITKY